jgi:hypothetical protein
MGLLILLIGCGQAQPAAQPSPTPESRLKPAGSVAAVRPPGAPRVPVTVDGTRDARTEVFQLEGGHYEVAWAITPPPDGGCSGSLALTSPDQPLLEALLVSGIDSRNALKGTTQSEVKIGSYSVSSTLNCPVWSVRFIPV